MWQCSAVQSMKEDMLGAASWPSPGNGALVVTAAVHLAAIVVRGGHVYVELQHGGAAIVLWVA